MRESTALPLPSLWLAVAVLCELLLLLLRLLPPAVLLGCWLRADERWWEGAAVDEWPAEAPCREPERCACPFDHVVLGLVA